MQYTELHLHTHYSLLDGLNTPAEYMDRAAELGMTHLAITDHGSLAGHREFQEEAKRVGITPILGLEAYISPTDRFDRRAVKKRDDNTQVYNHIGLLAMNEKGLNNLNRLSEIAWTEGFYHKPRIDMDLLEEYNDGLIVLSGCLNGLVAKALQNHQMDDAVRWAKNLHSVFGERFFLEDQAHNPGIVQQGLLEISKKLNIPRVLTGDCHHANPEDVWREDALLILSTSPKPDNTADFKKSQKMDMLERLNYLYPDRTMTFQDYELFLKSAEHQMEVYGRFGDNEECIKNTQVIANMIGDYPHYEGLNLLPQPKTEDASELLRKKVMQGLKARGLDKDEASVARANEELDIICGLEGYPAYFIIEANAVQWARSKGIFVGPGRGSAVGSMVCYALGITRINPLKHNLLFFRFINPERNDFPDIDTDFEDSRRGEVKSYMLRQYKHVASIATWGRFAGKNSVKDAARVFRVPFDEVNRALKGADYPANADFFAVWLATERGKNFKATYPEVVDLAKFLHGRIRSQGMHAGGIVVANRPINEIAPMQTVSDPNDKTGPRIPLVALDMTQVESLGLIKYDFLGLKTLSVVSDTLKTIKERHGIDIDLDALPLDDKRVYELLSDGYTKGVFQAEQQAYTNTIIDMHGVSTFEELVASNALVRPGAADSSAGKDFINRKNGKEHVQYYHPDMEWFTKDTYGTIIYQEQVMLTMTELAGMDMATADKVRKIIGKKRDVSEFEQYKEQFVEGASKKVRREIAERLWHDFEAHANYSFNLSHAVAYSTISYWTAWLKVNYPLEYMLNMLRHEGSKDTRLEYLIEAKRLGLRVVLPHVNMSDIGFSIQSDERGDFIRFGLSSIKYISDVIGKRLLDARPFKSYNELYELVMTKGSGLNTRALQGLNAIGAAAFEDNPRTGKERENLYEYLAIPAFDTQQVNPRIMAQLQTLDEYEQKGVFTFAAMVQGIKTGVSQKGFAWTRLDLIDETGSTGVFVDNGTPIEAGKMYVFLVADNSVVRYISVEDLLEDKGGKFQEFLEAQEFPDIPDEMWRVVSFKSRTTKNNSKMANVVLSNNEKELVTALVFPRQFHKAYGAMKDGAVVDLEFGQTDDETLFVANVL